MKCHKIRRLIPDFLEVQLNSKIHREISEHLQSCKDCAKEKILYEQSWQLIGQWQDIKPEPGFKTRFWSRVINQTETKTAPHINIFRLPRPVSLALVTAATIVIIITIALPNYLRLRGPEILVSKMNEEEIILVENIDLVENLEVIQAIDFLENMEIIENLGKFKLDTV